MEHPKEFRGRFWWVEIIAPGTRTSRISTTVLDKVTFIPSKTLAFRCVDTWPRAIIVVPSELYKRTGNEIWRKSLWWINFEKVLVEDKGRIGITYSIVKLLLQCCVFPRLANTLWDIFVEPFIQNECAKIGKAWLPRGHRDWNPGPGVGGVVTIFTYGLPHFPHPHWSPTSYTSPTLYNP